MRPTLEKTQGSAKTVLAGDVLETRFLGVVDGTVLEHVIADAQSSTKLAYWFVDTSKVDTYTPSIRAPAAQLLGMLKHHGVREIVAVVPSAAIRMVASALCLAAGLKIKMLATEADARAALSEARRAHN